MRKPNKIVGGFYQVMAMPHGFANIHKRPDGWHADIRDRHGNLLRYAGIWKSLREARGEVEDLLDRLTRREVVRE